MRHHTQNMSTFRCTCTTREGRHAKQPRRKNLPHALIPAPSWAWRTQRLYTYYFEVCTSVSHSALCEAAQFALLILVCNHLLRCFPLSKKTSCHLLCTYTAWHGTRTHTYIHIHMCTAATTPCAPKRDAPTNPRPSRGEGSKQTTNKLTWPAANAEAPPAVGL